jgi:exopolysaccharide biosynthesis predicted pyruvyltransferase EpsI
VFDQYEKLKEVLLAKCEGKPVFYCPNKGNWGDAVIREGTIKFFKDIGLRCRELPPKRRKWLIPLLQGGVAIYGGGGAFVEHYQFAERIVQKLSQRFEVVVMPSTFSLSLSCPNTIFFRRDDRESRSMMPESRFCHDMGFYLGKLEAPRGCGEGNFFRQDIEKTERSLPEGNRDMSAEGNHNTPLTGFFEAIGEFETINTNRLHVAIVAALQGKNVNLYPNSYFKNKAVFHSSLEPHFPKVRFCE